MIFRQDKSLRRWHWEYLENPYRQANIVILQSPRAGVIGHYGGILVRFNFFGDVIPVSQLVDVMIHPAFRGRATLDRLVRAFIQRSRDNGIRLLYGFNKRVIAESNRRFFGAEVAAVPEWVREISGLQPRADPSDAETNVFPGEEVDVRVDALWDRIKAGFACATVRDSNYLNWRYSPRSDRSYTFWATADPSSGALRGLAVFGLDRSDGVILELLADPEDEQAMTSMLRASLAHFVKARVARVRVWLSAHGKFRKCAEEAGFRRLDSGFYLNLLPLDDSLSRTVLREHFYYTLGDYDVY